MKWITRERVKVDRAMPKMPEMNEVTTATTARAARMSGVNIRQAA